MIKYTCPICSTVHDNNNMGFYNKTDNINGEERVVFACTNCKINTILKNNELYCSFVKINDFWIDIEFSKKYIAIYSGYFSKETKLKTIQFENMSELNKILNIYRTFQ